MEKEVKKLNCKEETALFDTQRTVFCRILGENKGKYASYKYCYEHNLFKFFGHRVHGKELTTILINLLYYHQLTFIYIIIYFWILYQ